MILLWVSARGMLPANILARASFSRIVFPLYAVVSAFKRWCITSSGAAAADAWLAFAEAALGVAEAAPLVVVRLGAAALAAGCAPELPSVIGVKAVAWGVIPSALLLAAGFTDALPDWVASWVNWRAKDFPLAILALAPLFAGDPDEEELGD